MPLGQDVHCDAEPPTHEAHDELHGKHVGLDETVHVPDRYWLDAHDDASVHATHVGEFVPEHAPERYCPEGHVVAQAWHTRPDGGAHGATS